jgi:hypothetical protein
MIDSLYGKYFQKSRSFLYPALGIKKDGKFTPSGTYISLEGMYDPDDMKLICGFFQEQSEEFKEFENQMLIGNPLFVEAIPINEYCLYVFDYQIYKADWFNFLMGKYSKLSIVLKKAIINYYGEASTESSYMESYLYPEKYFDIYGKLLDMDPYDLKRIGELCDPWDDEKEIMKIPVDFLENLKKQT